MKRWTACIFGLPPIRPLSKSASSFKRSFSPSSHSTYRACSSETEEMPAIAISKVNSPTQVRGDLSPPANTVTSTFTVTNPGNTPLSTVTVTDNKCTPVFQSGDTNSDGRLDLTESWIFTCARNFTNTPGSSPILVTNTAEAKGVDPNGTVVSANATANATAYAPKITLTKTATPTTS